MKFFKNEESTSTQNFTCFECRKKWHIKEDCPKFYKKSSHQGREESKSKKAYIAWYGNEVISSSDSESEECANIALMESHYSDDEEV